MYDATPVGQQPGCPAGTYTHPLPSPDPLQPPVVHIPSSTSQQGGDPAVAIAAEPSDQSCIVIGRESGLELARHPVPTPHGAMRLGNSTARHDDNLRLLDLVDVFLGGAVPLGYSLSPILPRVNVRILDRFSEVRSAVDKATRCDCFGSAADRTMAVVQSAAAGAKPARSARAISRARRSSRSVSGEKRTASTREDATTTARPTMSRASA